jgi:HSP20 family molecular chaperone IbpA
MPGTVWQTVGSGCINAQPVSLTECVYGGFERAIPLPATVDSDRAVATYTNGLLRIKLPKPDARRSESVKVAVM